MRGRNGDDCVSGGHPQNHLFGDIGTIQEHCQEWLCHKGKCNPRGWRGERRLYNRVGAEPVRGEGGSPETSPVMSRALRLKER